MIKELNHEMFLGGLYITPQGSSTFTNSSYYKDVHTQIREDVACYLDKTPYVSLCGDFISRTGVLSEIETHVSDRNCNIVSELNNAISHVSGTDQIWYNEQRKSIDKTVNAFGKDLKSL